MRGGIKMFHNEKGGALPTVLLLMILFTTIGLTMLSMNLSSTKQFNKKEENVQARHLAEMGVLHYKTLIDQRVMVFNADPNNYLKYKDKDKKIIDQEASRIAYCNNLYSKVSKFSVSVLSPPLETGSYSTKDINGGCNLDKNEIVLFVTSNGSIKEKDNSDAVIDATITIAPLNNGNGNDNIKLDPFEQVPKKPTFSGSKTQILTLDDIKNLKNVSVVYSQTNKNPFSTDAFVELLGSVDIQKKSNWAFNNNLIINGSLGMKTAGSNTSILDVENDLFIGGALHTDNHNIINVDGNFMAMGRVNFGTKSVLNVGGNALFDSQIEVIDTHAEITIQQNAYFKKQITNVKNKASVCVKGDIYLWKNNQWSPYLPEDTGYDAFNKNCLRTSEPIGGGLYNWLVHPNIEAEYY